MATIYDAQGQISIDTPAKAHARYFAAREKNTRTRIIPAHERVAICENRLNPDLAAEKTSIAEYWR